MDSFAQMDSLPTEVIEAIMMNLNPDELRIQEKVCKKFKNIVNNPAFINSYRRKFYKLQYGKFEMNGAHPILDRPELAVLGIFRFSDCLKIRLLGSYRIIGQRIYLDGDIKMHILCPMDNNAFYSAFYFNDRPMGRAKSFHLRHGLNKKVEELSELDELKFDRYSKFKTNILNCYICSYNVGRKHGYEFYILPFEDMMRVKFYQDGTFVKSSEVKIDNNEKKTFVRRLFNNDDLIKSIDYFLS